MKHHYCIILLLFSLLTVTVSFAGSDKKEIQQRVAAMTKEQKQARASEIRVRVEQIQQMDKSRLSGDQRQALRREMQDMKTETKAIGDGGSYLSFGGVVVLILVLVIVL